MFLKSRLNAPQNCYCVGRKTHLLEDKQIPSVGVFDEVSFYTLFRGHLTSEIMQISPDYVLNHFFLCF